MPKEITLGATQRLADFVSKKSFSQLPKEVVRQTKGIILDTLG